LQTTFSGDEALEAMDCDELERDGDEEASVGGASDDEGDEDMIAQRAAYQYA